ncbi:unnamed protein product [Bursaphelenchus xylophilus]|uniref:(pine wood nematode) hypothetical protein n=1 Tax=Bursaphelenchus xylophilus TaxID=6326 RepID=A0A1I7S4R3_BURXY|nr:unnamed protein product [Bursaphelenchus xylophilus]CAG9117316.1 unnamed protein product [Bursaphelenchus xylophilus]
MLMFRVIVPLIAFVTITTHCCQPIPPSSEIMEQIRLRLKQAIEAPSDPELQNLTSAQIAALEETIDRYARLPSRYLNTHEMFDEKVMEMFSKDQIRMFKDFVEKRKSKGTLLDDIKTLDDIHKH